MMRKQDFTPGQTVYLLEQRFMGYEYRVIEKRIKETKVLSVGRKYITVEYGKTKFDIANDFREVTSYSITLNLFLSKEDIEKKLNRRQMAQAIKNALYYNAYLSSKMTYEEVQTIYNIVKKYSKY